MRIKERIEPLEFDMRTWVDKIIEVSIKQKELKDNK